MSKIDTNVLKDGQLAVATAPQNGTIISDASAVDATALVQTDNGPQLCVKTVEVGEGGGGGGTVDQTYDPTSTNAQSGTAVAEAVAPALKNQAQTGTYSVNILGDISYASGNCATVLGIEAKQAQECVAIGYQATGKKYGIAIGRSSNAGSEQGIAIGYLASCSGTSGLAVGYNAQAGLWGGAFGNNAKATAQYAYQIGPGTNSTANTFQVFTFQLLDKTTGLIPAERLGTGYDATKTQVLKNVNGTLTWVDE